MNTLAQGNRRMTELQEKDLSVYAELLHMLHGQVLSLEHLQRALEKTVRYPYYKIFLALEKEDAIGTYSLIVLDNLGRGGAGIAVVENVAVKESKRSAGVGRWMMEHAMDLARAEGCYKLMLSSSLKREDAHLFYEHLGFERHGYSFSLDL